MSFFCGDSNRNNGRKKFNKIFVVLEIKIDERGIVLFAFHGSINKELLANEQGDYHGQTRIKSNGQWSYENNRYKLQRGDVLNFWLYVQHGNFGYKLENLRYVYPGVYRIKSTMH